MPTRVSRIAFASLIFAAAHLVVSRNDSLAQTDKAGDAEACDLRRASSHPIRYYISLPRRYEKEANAKRWPVLVCIVGADCVFEQRFKNYQDARGDLPFIVVCPCTFSNTNAIEGHSLKLFHRYYTDAEIRQADGNRLEWDERGLLAILEDLRRDFHADDRIFLTGFSGGGILTYDMLLNHPERLAAAIPVCANYFGDGGSPKNRPLTPGQAKIPVHVLLSEFDPIEERFLPTPARLFTALACGVFGAGYIVWRRTKNRRLVASITVAGGLALAVAGFISSDEIDPQSSAAIQGLRARGYTNVTVTTIPGMGHEPATDRVVGEFAAIHGQ